MKLFISVIMSVFNNECHLKESIQSILDQTYDKFEFIIVDDSSTDNSLRIIENFMLKDSRIRLIRNSKNIGLTKSLNIALKLAKGDYIARMDADDISKPLRFERQLNFLNKHKDYAIIGTRSIIIDKSSTPISYMKTPYSDRQIRKTFPLKNAFIHSSVMFSRNIVEQIGYYDESFTFAQDYELWCRIMLFQKGAILNQVFHYWRKIDEGISNKNKVLQNVFADAVRGRYGALYLMMEDRNIHSSKKQAIALGKLISIATINGNNSLYDFVLRKINDHNLSNRLIISVFNMVKGNKNNYLKDKMIVALEGIMRKNIFEKYQLASLYKQKGKTKEAKKIFKKLLNRNEKTIKEGAYFHLGEIEYQCENLCQAEMYFRKTLVLNRSHFKAISYLHKIKKLKKLL